jgi:hypothetical protein
VRGWRRPGGHAISLTRFGFVDSLVERNRTVRDNGGKNIPAIPRIPRPARVRQGQGGLEIALFPPATSETFPPFPTFPGSPVAESGVGESRERRESFGPSSPAAIFFRPEATRRHMRT